MCYANSLKYYRIKIIQVVSIHGLVVSWWCTYPRPHLRLPELFKRKFYGGRISGYFTFVCCVCSGSLWLLVSYLIAIERIAGLFENAIGLLRVFACCLLIGSVRLGLLRMLGLVFWISMWKTPVKELRLWIEKSSRQS